MVKALSIPELLQKEIQMTVPAIIAIALDDLLDTKLEPFMQQVLQDAVGGMLSDLADQQYEQFMLASEKLEQRFDEVQIRFDRLETKLDNSLQTTDRLSLEIRRLQRKGS